MQTFAPMVILILNLTLFSLFLSWLFPENDVNVNSDFASSARGPLIILAAGMLLIFLVLKLAARGRKFSFRNNSEKLRRGDVALILLPLTPVVQYIINNQDILSPLDSVYVLAVFSIFSILFIIVSPAVFRAVGSTRMIVSLGLAFTYTVTNMALLTSEFRWFARGSLPIQFYHFISVFLFCWLLYYLANRKLLYFAIAVFFLVNSTNQIASQGSQTAAPVWVDSGNGIQKMVGTRKPHLLPNIYLLVYDAYVSNETMIGYGLDNSAQEHHLKTLGFSLYPGTYSLFGSSIGSIGRVFSVTEDLYGNPRKAVSGDGAVIHILKGMGYATYGVFYSDYFFQGIGSSYDFSFPSSKASSSPPNLLVKAIFMGEFRIDIKYDQPTRAQFEGHKQRVFENIPGNPRFIYMHDDLPGHSQNSGICRPNAIALFEGRLSRANSQMKQDVEVILRNDPEAIIIVAGDHGPYLTKNCAELGDQYDISEVSRLDIQDRNGAFLAIKWPSEKFSDYDDITVLQDIFPAIFSFLFEDAGILATKVKSETGNSLSTGGVTVWDGMVQGGIHNGEPLFLD